MSSRMPRLPRPEPTSGRPKRPFARSWTPTSIISSEPSASALEGVRAKLEVGSLDDPLEAEADAMADAVISSRAVAASGVTDGSMIHRKCTSCEEDLEIHRKVSDRASQTNSDAEALVGHARSMGGVSMAPALRSSMESGFGRDLGDVRLHAGSASARAATSIGAKAFTAGHDVFFGAGQFSPGTPEGLRLIAHELAHVVQADGARRPRPSSDATVVRRSPSESSSTDAAESIPADTEKTYASLKTAFFRYWVDATPASKSQNYAAMREIAPRLAEVIPTDAMIEEGPEIMGIMYEVGASAAAYTIFQKIVDFRFSQWTVDDLQFGDGVENSDQSNTLPNKEDKDINGLFLAANKAVNADAFEHANDILWYIFIYAQVLAMTISTERREALIEANQKLVAGESGTQPALKLNVDPAKIIRRVFEFYPSRERFALTQGDEEEAKLVRAASRRLWVRLEKDIFSPVLTGGALLVLDMEKTTNERGQLGYEVSSDGNSEILTQMPNTPSIDKGPHYSGMRESNKKTIVALRGQGEFLAAVYRFPGVRDEFPYDPPNMLSLDDRIRVWAALVNDLASGNQNLLLHLIDYIQIYLKSYTRHSYYNIRDFGGNYLDTHFPTDYAGRLIQDCGVYALTTAYELLQVSKKTGEINIATSLVTTLDHVMLTVIDRDNDSAYVLNNDNFIGPIENSENEIVSTLARAYGGMNDEEHSFIRMRMVDMMDSDEAKKTSSKKTKDQLQGMYQTATHWGFSRPKDGGEIDSDPNVSYHLYRGEYNKKYKAFREFVLELNHRAVGETTAFHDISTPDLLAICIDGGIEILHIYVRVKCKPYSGYTHALDRQMDKLGSQEIFRGSNDHDKGDMLHLLVKLIGLFNDMSAGAQDFLGLMNEATGQADCRRYYPSEYSK